MGESKKYQVKFFLSGKSIKVTPGYKLHQAVLDCGLTIDSSCGESGIYNDASFPERVREIFKRISIQ